MQELANSMCKSEQASRGKLLNVSWALWQKQRQKTRQKIEKIHLSHSVQAMLYAFRFDSWVKLGWSKTPMQRASDGFWENSHPTDLCGKLCPPHCKLIGLWEGTKEEENALQEQFNEGILKKGDAHNEFYPIEEWAKIHRDLMTYH